MKTILLFGCIKYVFLHTSEHLENDSLIGYA